MKKWRLLLLLLCFFLIQFNTKPTNAEEKCLQSFFQKSLHFTGEGMRYWYEAEDGLMSMTKIPYDKLGCAYCHVDSCDKCHGTKNKEGALEFSINKARKVATCYTCHERGKLAAMIAEKNNQKDVHTAAKMVCTSCHKEHDIHGDGTLRQSMRAPDAVKASCEGCHMGEKTKAPKFDVNLKAHKKHKNSTKLHCSACHVRGSMTCYNCHLSEFIRTKEKKDVFIPTNDWLMLVNYQGKVTAGTAMVIVYENQAYVSYTPYFTHNVMKKGRACEECHGIQAAEMVKQGKKIPLVAYKNDKITFFKGVIPVAKDILEWKFFDKKDGKWIPLDLENPTIERFSLYAEPLNQNQLRDLSLKLRSAPEKTSSEGDK